MNNIIAQYAPKKWKFGWDNLPVEYEMLDYNDAEYERVEKLFINEGIDVGSVRREQNLYRYGRFLVRQQSLAMKYPNQQYYRVRRFVSVPEECVEVALKYQIDNRRCCGDDHEFMEEPDDDFYHTFIVVAITTDQYEEFEPQKDSDFYIEYVVEHS